MTLMAESVMLEMGPKIQYICTLVREEALYKFYSLSADVEDVNYINMETVILGLASYFPCTFIIEARAHDAPWNEEAMRFKSYNIRGLCN